MKIRADRDAGCRWRGLHRLNALNGGSLVGAGVLEESQHVGPKGLFESKAERTGKRKSTLIWSVWWLVYRQNSQESRATDVQKSKMPA